MMDTLTLATVTLAILLMFNQLTSDVKTIEEISAIIPTQGQQLPRLMTLDLSSLSSPTTTLSSKMTWPGKSLPFLTLTIQL